MRMNSPLAGRATTSDVPHPNRADQPGGRLHAVAMVLEVHPDAVEAHQARQFEDAGIDQMKLRDQDRLAALELRFDTAGSHRYHLQVFGRLSR